LRSGLDAKAAWINPPKVIGGTKGH
jgi:hypothetical protein